MNKITATAVSVKNSVVKHRTKILIVTNVATIGACVLMRSDLASHNAFLAENNLLDQFKNLTSEV